MAAARGEKAGKPAQQNRRLPSYALRITHYASRLPPRRTLLLLASIFPILIVAGLYFWLSYDLPAVQGLQARAPFASNRILDRNGKLLYELFDPRGGQRSKIPLAEIPQAVRDATISTEDDNFYHHPGVDLWGLTRALWQNFSGGEVVSGGSTITQQLARTLLLTPEEAREQSFRRKGREALLAYRIESSYSKDEILEMYLNGVYYGNMAYGIDAASHAYFGKPARDLDLAEAALLAGLTQAPGAYDPLTDPTAAEARRRAVLDLMVKHGYLSEFQAQAARDEPLSFAQQRFPIEAPHFVMWVRDQLESRFGQERLLQGGLTVETTLDAEMQQAAERTLLAKLADLKDQHVTNGAVVVLDTATGQVRVMLGSADYFDPAIDGEVNVALAPRQPGSSIKPLTYAAALARDFTAATVLPDIPTTYPSGANGNGQTYVPANYDLEFHGPQRLRLALANSYNIPAVYTLNHIGVYELVRVARAAGISTWEDDSRFGLALTLGGGEVRLLDLTAAYGAFAHAGVPLAPYGIVRVRDDNGQVIYDAATDPELTTKREPLFGPHSAQVAYLISDILSDNSARLPAFGEDSALRLSRQAAAKTGTTSEWRDNWTVGYTPNYIAGVWVGNSDNSAMIHSTGVTGAAPVWHDLMETIHRGLPERWFDRPDGLVRERICALSGLLPSDGCRDQVDELFIAGTAPTETDTWQQLLRIDNATGLLSCPGAADSTSTRRVFNILPPQYAAWSASIAMSLPPLAYAPGCSSGASGGDSASNLDLAITSPLANSFGAGKVQIMGRVSGAGVSGYRLEWGEGATPSSWQNIASGAVANGERELGLWDTGGRTGIMSLRLVALLSDGGERAVNTRINLDNVPPATWITYPAEGSDLSSLGANERFPLQVEVQDNFGVATVLFYLDGALLGRRDAAPWTLMVGAGEMKGGQHELSAVAVDQAGNRSEPARVNIRR